MCLYLPFVHVSVRHGKLRFSEYSEMEESIDL